MHKGKIFLLKIFLLNVQPPCQGAEFLVDLNEWKSLEIVFFAGWTFANRAKSEH